MVKSQQPQSGASGRRHHVFSYKYWIMPQASLGPSRGQLQTRRMDQQSVLEIVTLPPHWAQKAGFIGHPEQQQIPQRHHWEPVEGSLHELTSQSVLPQ